MYILLQPSEQNTYADIEAAYKCLEESYGAKQEEIILYGQSVGSGPTLDLAARLPRLRAVVLHSPILSGLRVMYPVKRSYWFDIYKVKCLTSCMLIQVLFFFIRNYIAISSDQKFNGPTTWPSPRPGLAFFFFSFCLRYLLHTFYVSECNSIF